MATPSTQMPIIYVRVPAFIKNEPIIVRSGIAINTVESAYDSFFFPNETRSRTDALPIARAITAHHGYLPPGHDVLLSGPVDATKHVA
jgi:hypothetical protein